MLNGWQFSQVSNEAATRRGTSFTGNPKGPEAAGREEPARSDTEARVPQSTQGVPGQPHGNGSAFPPVQGKAGILD